MPLSNTELKYYDSNILRLPDTKRTEYHEQVDRLIKELKNSLKSQDAIKITKVVKAGSFAKFTILRKTQEDPVDVDIVFYISGENASQESLSTISQKIYDALITLYPNKSVEDFELQRKAATVTFIKSGLNVDVVPVIEDADRVNYGWQFDIHEGTKLHTCAPCQIQFIRDRKSNDSNFRTLVRLAKKWRNHAELTHLKSFVIELILAYLLDQNGNSGSIEERFRQFLLYIAQHGLKEIISFPENKGTIPDFNDPVVIIDPVCDTNNVASRLTEAERVEIVAAAQSAWEQAHYASVTDDITQWKVLFGARFKIKDES
ncbi:CBASS oligonucleotide cyclase [Pantoea sp. JK]|uniref:CBASS oligonucleotide cyclase n=1 Tax=Pantoea sp. JK TaxID=2871703 RepID=UPI002238048B|nr:CBASS oligonucleotide cyclase [Pantoea sp. JK]MCW6034463.1 nucleotidyltransferase [Pantoea sp. JK]